MAGEKGWVQGIRGMFNSTSGCNVIVSTRVPMQFSYSHIGAIREYRPRELCEDLDGSDTALAGSIELCGMPEKKKRFEQSGLQKKKKCLNRLLVS